VIPLSQNQNKGQNMNPFQFKNQENLSLRQRAAADIRHAIISGELKPGSKLKELEISAQMGISRGPIREALRDLEAMGLVISSPYRETIVADVQKEEIVDLLIPVRLQLELYAIKYNLANFDETFLQALNTMISNMRLHAIKNNLFGLVEEDIRFHEHILSLNDTAYTQQIWTGIVNRLRLHFIKNTQKFPNLTRVANDHAILLEALTTKDYELISKVWTQHICHEDSLLCFS
jgi:DNA-binding GntR family transcriptional regulator